MAPAQQFDEETTTWTRPTLGALLVVLIILAHPAFGQVWVAADGSNATGQRGQRDRPFATIDAAIDASQPGDIIHIGPGLFASPTRFLANPPTLNDLTFQGAGKPSFNADSTALVGGTRLYGSWQFNAWGGTIRNITIRDLGLDNGATVCDTFFGGAAQEGLATTGDTLDSIIGMRVTNLVSLCKNAAAAVHAYSFQCCLDSMFSQLEARYGTHGFAVKSRHCTFTDLIARGHSNNGMILASSHQSLQCAYVSIHGLLVGPMIAGDTSAALVLGTGNDSVELRHITVSNLVASGVKVGVEFRLPPSGTGDASALALNNVTIEGTGAPGGAGMISTVSGAGRVRAQLANVTIRNFETGFSLGGEFDLSNCAVEDCPVGLSLLRQNGQTRWRNLSIRNADIGVNLVAPQVHYLSEVPKFTNVTYRYWGAGGQQGVVVLPQHWRLRNAGAAIRNTGAETSLLQTVAPEGSRVLAPSLQQSQPIRLRAGGMITHAGGPILTFRVKLGSVTLATATIPVATGSAKAWSADLTIQARTDSPNPGYPAVTGHIIVNNTTFPIANGQIPVNLSLPNKLDFTAQWSRGSAVNSIHTETAVLEVGIAPAMTLP